MRDDYEAVVETNLGTFRVRCSGREILEVTEDGIDGVAGTIELDAIQVALWAPEVLVSTLLSWIYEMQRSAVVLSAHLSLRTESRFGEKDNIEP